MANVDAIHIPYKGGAPAVTDLVAGRLSLMMANLTTAQPHIRSGRLRSLGIGTKARSPLFPEMPTVAESGVPGYEANNWNGIVVPSGTPGAIVNLLQTAVADVLKEPVIAERMAKSALDPIGDTPAEFARYLRAEAQKWGKLVKSAGIKAE
jgi:tripartite-type tricarboxylate transporter receptor subunit TctC